MRKIVSLFLSVFFTMALFGQGTVIVTGDVAVDEEKIGGILITVENRNLGTITDASGHFELKVPIGQQTLLFRVHGLLRHHQLSEFNKDSKYHWDVNIGPKYSESYLIRMKNEAREEELEFTEVSISTYVLLKGTVGFDEMFLPNANVKIIETGQTTKTNAKGEFEIWATEGIQTVEFSFRGFEPFSHKVQIDTKKKYNLKAKFGPAYNKEFLEKKKAEGTLNQLKRSKCTVEITD